MRISEKRRKWWILGAMTATISMIFIDITVLPVALPTISRELAISNLALQWIVNAYTLALTVFVLAGGRLADMWGLKRGFCFGLALFALSSALCGLAETGGWIIFSRALQGLGAALMLPATQAIIANTFPPHERGKAMGMYVSVGSVFLSLGPLVGGSFTQYLTWRYVFWINLPIAALGMMLALLIVPNYPKKGRETFDWVGFVTLSIGVSAIVIAVMNAQLWGITSLLTVLLLVLGIVLITFLLRAERAVSHPLVDWTLFKKKTFASGSAVVFCNQFLIMVTVFWAIYFQDVMLFSPSQAGMIVFISSAPSLFAAPLAGFLVDRLGPRQPVIIGFSLIGFSLLWFFFHGTTPQLTLLLPALIPFGIGIPLVFTPSFVSLTHNIPPEKRGGASGMNIALRQFGATLGLAIFGMLFHHGYSYQFAHRLKINSLTHTLAADQFEELLAGEPRALHAFAKQSSEVQIYIRESLTHAYVSALDLINFAAALFCVLGIVIAWKWMQNRPMHSEN